MQKNNAAKIENGHSGKSTGNFQLMSYPAEYYVSFGKSDINSVKEVLRENSISLIKKQPSLNEQHKDRIIAMYQSGSFPKKIAEETGISISTIHWILKKFGVHKISLH